jgi:tRNA 5-methylaminomethyl-2-thiouridine biosynthesis bifunctional protein
VAEATAVIVATAAAANELLGANALPLSPLRGQITLLPRDALAQAPRCVVCAEGYVAPPHGEWICCGASFVRGAGDFVPTAAEHHDNLQRLHQILPHVDPAGIEVAALAGRVGYRASTPDRLPVAGPVPDIDASASPPVCSATRHPSTASVPTAKPLRQRGPARAA